MEAVPGRNDPPYAEPAIEPAWLMACAKACACCGGREKPFPSCKVTIRIPGFTVVGGGETSASEAAIESVAVAVWGVETEGVGVLDPSEASLLLIVDVEVERPDSEFLRGPRWVSLNSKADRRERFLTSLSEPTHSWLDSTTSLENIEDSQQRMTDCGGSRAFREWMKGGCCMYGGNLQSSRVNE